MTRITTALVVLGLLGGCNVADGRAASQSSAVEVQSVAPAPPVGKRTRGSWYPSDYKAPKAPDPPPDSSSALAVAGVGGGVIAALAGLLAYFVLGRVRARAR